MLTPPRLAVLYVQHSPARYPDALPTLRACLDRLWFCDPLLLVIDNSREGDWCTWMGDHEAVIGGDNRDWEFSGWQRGVEVVRALGRGHDMFLLTNESFLAPGPSFLLDHPSYDRICGWRREGVVAGRIDRYEAPVTLYDRPIPSWVCTSAMFVPADAVDHIGGLVSLAADDLRDFLPAACPANATRQRVAYFPSTRPGVDVTVTLPLDGATSGLLAVEPGERCDPWHMGRGDGPPLGVQARHVSVGGQTLGDALFASDWHLADERAWSGARATAGFAGPFARSAATLTLAAPPWATWPGHRRDVIVRFTSDPFLPEAPIAIAYRLRILEWLTVHWRQRFALGPATWATFRRKTQSILNEALLTRRLIDAGYPIVESAPGHYY